VEFLDYPFMKAALLMGLILGTLFSLMGIFVVTKGMSFFSDFIAHAAILGGALAVLAGMDISLFLIPYSLALALAVSAVWNSLPLSRDTVLGVFYGGAVAMGIIVISTKGLGGQSLLQFLFGDILLVGPTDIWLSTGLLAAFLLFAGLNTRRLLKASLLPEMSQAEGINVRRYDYALMALMAVTIALSIKLIGVILANAMVVIPAAAAKTVSGSFRQFVIIAPAIGVLSFSGGLILSFYANLPSGPSVIACAFALFLLSLFARLLKGRA
jgi:zinc/manganese transport system permease protein